MAPNSATGPLCESDVIDTEQMAAKYIIPEKRKVELVWRNIIIFTFLHLACLYGIYLSFTSAKWKTIFLAVFMYKLSGLGIGAGAHRLWAHRAYKAKWPLRLFLVLCNAIAFQDSVVDWVRDHRVHHKFTETDADPHNANRGFFFSHIGWLLVRKHPEVRIKGKGIDLSDVTADPIVRFQKKYYFFIMPLLSFIAPTLIPWYYWGESVSNAWYVCLMRYCLSLNAAWVINSVAHLWGPRPYDKHIGPVENIFIAIAAMGEGWHNYHHTFPWDYKTSELGSYATNETAMFLDFCAMMGWAYDMKSVSEEMVKQRVLRTGDGTHINHGTWGWGDKDQTQEERDSAVIIAAKID